MVLAILMACSAFVLIVAQSQGIRRGVLFFDAAAQFGIPPYAGFFSNVGILALTAAAAICLFALPLSGGRERSALRLGGLLSALLAVDDLFMIHDWLLTEFVGIPETIPFALYGVLTLVLFASMGRQVLAPGAALLWLSLAFMALSLFFDLIEFRVGWDGLAEEMAKLCGFVVWAMFWAGYANAAIAGARRRGWE